MRHTIYLVCAFERGKEKHLCNQGAYDTREAADAVALKHNDQHTALYYVVLETLYHAEEKVVCQ
jgi:hypothetical protein